MSVDPNQTIESPTKGALIRLFTAMLLTFGLGAMGVGGWLVLGMFPLVIDWKRKP